MTKIKAVYLVDGSKITYSNGHTVFPMEDSSLHVRKTNSQKLVGIFASGSWSYVVKENEVSPE